MHIQTCFECQQLEKKLTERISRLEDDGHVISDTMSMIIDEIKTLKEGKEDKKWVLILTTP